MKRSWLTVVFLAVVAFMGTTIPALAQQVSWTNTAGGNWSIAGNWNPNAVPGSGTNVFLTNTSASAYIITNDFLNATMANLTEFNGGAGRVTLLNNNTGFNPSGNVVIGRNGIFDLNGFAVTSGGTLTISNLGSVVVNGAQWTVGSTVTNGGTISLTNSGSLVSGILTNGGGGIIRVLNSSGTIGGFVLNSGSINLSGLDTVSGSGVISLTNGAFNRGTISLSTNSILNVGGTDQATANASTLTLTNTGTIVFGRFTNTLNASTAVVGIVNQGTIKNDQVAPVPISTINAVVVNDTGGQIQTATSIADQMTFYALPTNRGTITIGINTPLTLNNGGLYNAGTVAFATSPGNQTLSAINGTFFNETNGLLTANGAFLKVISTLNNGSMVISNTGASGQTFDFGGPVTNNGSIQIYRPISSAFNDNTIRASNLVNSGTITGIGIGSMLTNTLPVNSIAVATTNLSTGTIISTNASLFVFRGNFQNQGTIRVESNSVLAIGAFLNTSEGAGKITAGLTRFQNDGTIALNDGTFATAQLTNAATATLQGHGDVGRAQFTNMISGSVTNFARQFEVRDIVNAGTIAPNGALNAGNITNLAGGKIVGSGSIQSVNVTNFYVGATFVTSNYNTGARVQNNAGATIRASGGTLVLSNGFFGNTQSGTLGATNGGRLQLGDGTFSLTNNGVIALNGGSFASGDLTLSPAAYASGTAGDEFVLSGNFNNQSTNRTLFSIRDATVLFTNGISQHVLTSSARDNGSAFAGITAVDTNFAIGALELAAADTLRVTGGPSNALYIGELDIGGLANTNSLSSLTLDVNVYYDPSLNSYLGGNSYQLGTGALIPLIFVPEPSSVALVFLAISVYCLKRKKAKPETVAHG